MAARIGQIEEQCRIECVPLENKTLFGSPNWFWVVKQNKKKNFFDINAQTKKNLAWMQVVNLGDLVDRL